MQTLFYYFIVVYAFAKDFLRIPKGAIKKQPFLIGLLIQTFLFTVTIITILSTALFAVLVQSLLWLMDLYLWWKLGDNYGGRLKGQDAQLESTDEKVSVSVVLILNHNDDLSVVFKKLDNLAKKLHYSFYKLSCTVEKCLGYAYYVKNQVPVEGYCTYVKINDEEYLTKEAFMEHLQMKEMIKVINQKRLWYGKIFTQPILWSKRSDTNKQLACMLVFRHCLADGISLIGVLKNFMMQEENPLLISLDPKYSKRPDFSFDDVYVYRNPLTAPKDKPMFDIPYGERQVAFYNESEVKYVPLVKKLKTKLGIGFTEILIAGLTYSLAELLTKRGKSMDTCALGVLFRPINADLVSIINGTYDYDKLTNDSMIIMIKVPVNMKKGAAKIDRVKALSKEIDKAKHSIDGLAYYVIGNIGHMLPSVLLKYCMLYATNLTGGATNVGGLKVGTIGGYETESAMSFLSFYYLAGFRLSIFSKSDRFELAMTTRENILENRNEAQIVLNNIFQYIDELHAEIEGE